MMKLALKVPSDSSVRLGSYPQLLDEHGEILADWYGTKEQAESVVYAANQAESGVYGSAVQGRRDFRRAYRQQRELASNLKEALADCLAAMNPTDRSGISLHEWQRRLKTATKRAEEVLAVPKRAKESET